MNGTRISFVGEYANTGSKQPALYIHSCQKSLPTCVNHRHTQTYPTARVSPVVLRIPARRASAITRSSRVIARAFSAKNVHDFPKCSLPRARSPMQCISPDRLKAIWTCT